MHGSTVLFDDFIAAAPAGAEIDVVPLPAERLDYPTLATRFASTLHLTAETVLIAESFSGPLAIMLAARHLAGALILCNTFAVHPYTRALGFLPLELLARARTPDIIIRHYIVGPNASDNLVNQVRAAITSVPAGIFGFRAHQALRVDVSAQMAQCKLPILYLRGTADHLVRQKSVREIVDAATVPVSVAYLAGPHLLLKTAPHEAWHAINEFLSISGDT